MRIVIDLQCIQASGHQNISFGAYVLDLVKAIVRHRGIHEIIITLSGLFPDSIPSIRAEFSAVLPRENIRIWYAVSPVNYRDSKNDWRRRTAELTREAFLTQLKPDMVLVGNLFAGLDDNAVTSIGLLNQVVPTAVLVYDALPDSHLNNPTTEAWYLNKYTHLGHAHLLFVVSESLRRDCLVSTNLPPEYLINLSNDIEQGIEFSVDTCAKQTISAFETWHQAQKNIVLGSHVRRPKLAYISPLPPARSGISYYSAELLPALNRFYDIDVIIAEEEVTDSWIKANCQIRTVEWFRAQGLRYYERVLYHFGNSPFHIHMFKLLEEIPGVVVLHDFFLSDLVGTHMDYYDGEENRWAKELYHGHGYKAVQDRFHTASTVPVIAKYPCNLSMLQEARGVVVHSESSKRLAKQYYDLSAANDWHVIPLVQRFVADVDKHSARRKLKYRGKPFIVCSFGLLGSTKQNHRVLEAWIASSLANDKHCILVFVGEVVAVDYEQYLEKLIAKSGCKARIHITGWVDTDSFRNYLAAADVAVQFRASSRGETSAAVLDCMNYGLATIVNANGSMADLPDHCVWKLPDEFTNEQLIDALEKLKTDDYFRRELGEKAREFIQIEHAPQVCAQQYFAAIEESYKRDSAQLSSLIDSIAKLPLQHSGPEELTALAHALEKSIRPPLAQRQLFLDISALVETDLKTGIQRVVRSILTEWLSNSPEGFRIEPIYCPDKDCYRYARRFTLNFLGCPTDLLEDEPIEYHAGDVYLGLDLAHYVVVSNEFFYQDLRRQGVEVFFLIYDLLPIQFPQAFYQLMDEWHQKWLKIVVQNDGAICISKTVADEFRQWIQLHCAEKMQSFKISWFHLGADIKNSVPTKGLPEGSSDVLTRLKSGKTFLMVGTIEPRKGYIQALAAFEQLWLEHDDLNLVIIGKKGWMMDPFIEKLRHHPESGKRLLWLEGISDEYMEKIYKACTCLIAASEGEGFGLPLIEAAQHKLSILARNIAVFREVAGVHAHYFSGTAAEDLARAIKQWLSLDKEGLAPQSKDMPWLTWEQSAKKLAAALI